MRRAKSRRRARQKCRVRRRMDFTIGSPFLYRNLIRLSCKPPLPGPLLQKGAVGVKGALGRPTFARKLRRGRRGSRPYHIYLPFPVVNVLVLFLGGDVVERNCELERAGGLLDLALEVTRRGHQLRRAERREVALFQLALNAAKLFAESIDAVAGGREPLFAQGFEFDGMKVLDLELA